MLNDPIVVQLPPMHFELRSFTRSVHGTLNAHANSDVPRYARYAVSAVNRYAESVNGMGICIPRVPRGIIFAYYFNV